MQVVQGVDSTKNVKSLYGQWAAQVVAVQIKSAGARISLRGIILGETPHAIRFRVDGSWDIDIYKHMILAVEEESWMDAIT